MAGSAHYDDVSHEGSAFVVHAVSSSCQGCSVLTHVQSHHGGDVLLCAGRRAA